MSRRFLLAPLIAMATACSNPAPARDPPPPQGAASMQLEGADEARVRQAVSDLRMALPEGADLKLEHFRLAPGASWAIVAAHYDEALGRGWVVDWSVPEARAGYRARVWRRAGGAPAFVAAVMPGSAAGDILVTGGSDPAPR